MRVSLSRALSSLVRWSSDGYSSCQFTIRAQSTQAVNYSKSVSEPQRLGSKRGNVDDAYDVVIVGSGMVGSGVCCGLASNLLASSLRVAIVDGNPDFGVTSAASGTSVPDSRVSAITPSTVQFLKDVDVWRRIQSSQRAPFDSMQVWDYFGKAFTRYNAADVGEPVLGYVVENSVLVAALQSVLKHTGYAEVICPAQVKAVHFESNKTIATEMPPTGRLDWIMSKMMESSSTQVKLEALECQTEVGDDNFAQVLLGDGRLLRTRLVVAADGGRSKVRASAGLKTTGWDYNQHAVICTVKVAYEHSTAWQRFLPTGPLAVLPMGGDYSNIVWSTTPEQAIEFTSMSNENFVEHVNQALTKDYGAYPSIHFGSDMLKRLASSFSHRLTPSVGETFQVPPAVVRCLSKRLRFPLSLAHANSYVAPRLALVGDAAHTIHPLAGQGVNLGFGDAASLVKIICEGIKIGSDIGEISLLDKYQHDRLWANVPMMAILDGFQRIFGADFLPLNLARAAGFNTVQLLGPLKKHVITFAMGRNYHVVP